MYWPDTGTGVDTEPARKPVASAVRKYFTEGGVGVPPTVPGGDWFNAITNEVLNVLDAAGIDPSKTDDDQLLLAIQRISKAMSAREALRRTYAEVGFNLVPGSFELGGTVTTATDVLLYEADGHAYNWDGVFPGGGKVVPQNSTPATTGGVGPDLWLDQAGATLRGKLSSSGGASQVGNGNTTVGRQLDSEVFIDFFAPVLDYGPIINASQQSGELGGTIRLRGERYPVLTTITRRAGWAVKGVGPYATELAWGGGTDPMIKNEQVILESRSGKAIGNNSGQYHTSLEDISLIGNGLGIGLLRGEAWWDRMVRVIIEGFDVGEQDGLGTSNVTGCYWCKNEQVWYRNNRVNLRVTDYSNLNTWANCRFSDAIDWDMEFIEPTNPLTLGQQGNRFVDCEMASPDSVYLGARIFDMNFHNPYFEQSGYAVYDGTNHSKGSITFTGTPKFFGSQSVKNKVVAGHNGGNCQNWSFHNLKTNLGKGAGAPATMQVIDMGPTANYFSAIHPVLTGVDGWELTQPENYSKLKMQLFDVNGKSILQMASLSTEKSVTNVHHTVVDYTLGSNIGVDLFEKGVEVGELTTDWFTVMEVPDFAVTFAHAAFHYELTIGGRNPTSNNVKAAFLGGEIHGVNGAVGGFVEVFNRQSGSAQITVEHQAIQSGTSLLVQIRKSASSTAVFDQVHCAVESKTAGKFTELAI